MSLSQIDTNGDIHFYVIKFKSTKNQLKILRLHLDTSSGAKVNYIKASLISHRSHITFTKAVEASFSTKLSYGNLTIPSTKLSSNSKTHRESYYSSAQDNAASIIVASNNDLQSKASRESYYSPATPLFCKSKTKPAKQTGKLLKSIAILRRNLLYKISKQFNSGF